MLALALIPACAGDEGSSGPPADASPATQDAGVGELPFMAECTSNDQCATGLCFNFNAKGPRCTHACMAAAECEAPSPGCSGMHVCKAP